MIFDLFEASNECSELKMRNDILAIDCVVCLFLADLLNGFENFLQLVSADSQCIVPLLNFQFLDELEFLFEQHDKAT